MNAYRLGEFEEIVLLTVGILHGNAYGVTIKQEIEDRLNREVSVGALQTTLRRLESKGFLDSQHGDSAPARGGRPKLFFTLTAFGKRALAQARDVRNSMWDALPQIILNLE
ncbi:MAG: helix-turn-helix transcriptional regulator [Bacteroidota bacterium]